MMASGEPAAISLGVLTLRGDRSAAYLGNCELPLTFAQRRVLTVLLLHGGAVVDRETLYREALGGSLSPRSKAIDTHVGRIRRALGLHAHLIVSVDRVGYRIDADGATAMRGSSSDMEP